MTELPKEEGFIITRHTQFRGPRKIGIDSCCLYDLIIYPELFGSEHSRVFGIGGLFLTHRICFKEVTKKLIEKEKITKEEAEEKLAVFLKKNNITIIESDLQNKEILIKLYKNCKDKKINIHPPDSYIIADLVKNGVNKIFSTNTHFREACSAIGIDGAGFPSLDRQLKNKIREAFFRPKKKFNRHRR